MPTSYRKCQFVDDITQVGCDNWYDSEQDPKFCPDHRLNEDKKEKEVIHIPKTVTVMGENHIQALNEKIKECLSMSIPELAEHIKSIEDRIKDLERDRRAATIAKRNLEDRLTEEERAALRADTRKYAPGDSERPKAVRKTPEDKASKRKEGFSAWAARLGVKVDELMVMDDDEMASRIAKYKAQKG